MTTEIAIMNKSAVALAADSAVTITITEPQGHKYKVLNSAHKLFALSKCAPVGLMTYGNANLLGVPWETIVKLYREYLRDREFSKLLDYCDNFFEFLDNFAITDDVEKRYIESESIGLFNAIKNELDNFVKSETNGGKSITKSKVENKLYELINNQYKEFLKIGNKSALSKTKRSNLRNKYRDNIKDIAVTVFENLPLSKRIHSYLLTISINAASVGRLNQSGVVIAGFGKDDLFPSCKNYDVAAIFAGKTIKRDGTMHAITHEMGAAIIPFAQSDDVKTFMEGIGPNLSNYLKKNFYEVMSQGLPNSLTDEIGIKLNLNDHQKADIQKIATEMCKGACDYVFKELSNQQHTNP